MFLVGGNSGISIDVPAIIYLSGYKKQQSKKTQIFSIFFFYQVDLIQRADKKWKIDQRDLHIIFLN